jgi:hypothetical protein
MTQPVLTPATLSIVGEHAGVFRLGSWQDVCVCTWSGQPTVAVVATLFELLGKLREQRAVRRSYAHLIPDGLGLPDGPTRSAMIKIMREFETQLACVGMVIGGTGFWASAMRNAAIGLRVLAPRSFDYSMFATEAELLDWLPDAHQKQTGVVLSRAELASVLAEARRWSRA